MRKHKWLGERRERWEEHRGKSLTKHLQEQKQRAEPGRLQSNAQSRFLQELRNYILIKSLLQSLRAPSRLPEGPAISAHDGELTYRQLDNLSTRLAHQLVQYQVQDTIVPILIEKSAWTPVAQLGVMKAGAASVVLDVSQPEERLHTIIHSVKAQVILTSIANRDAAFRLSSDTPVLAVGDNQQSQHPGTKIELPSVSSHSRLYIVFTSGSTGVPKGAIITHSNFASAIRHQQLAMGFAPGQRVFDFASYAFDVAWSNFLHTITAGGCLCIPSDEERKQDIPAALCKYRAEYAHLTPSVSWFAPEELPETVKFLQFSGEELKADLVQAFGQRATIINTYGPAECSVTSTLQLVDASITDHSPPIGLGVGSCTWVVSLDGSQLVPIGAVGELWIEGPTVGGGYLNDPEKTSMAFVENPSWLLHSGSLVGKTSEHRDRLYRTGDLVHYNRHDGSLSFVGRKDNQVKIRGQRVELGEIEHHLRDCLPDTLSQKLHIVADVFQPKGNSHPSMAAMISPRDEALRPWLIARVREAAALWEDQLPKRVPVYMIPSAYIPFDCFPLTGTGKLDRRGLRAAAAVKFWDHVGGGGEGDPAQSVPTSEREENIIQIWSEVLNMPKHRISTGSPFTRLGGDSITAMQVVSRCRARNISLTVGDVLRLCTVKALALKSQAAPAASLSAKTRLALAHASPEYTSQSWPLSPMQQLFFDAHPQGFNHYTQSFLLRVTRPITIDALRGSVTAVVKRHGMLRARFRRLTSPDRWEQTVVPPDSSCFAVAEHRYCPGRGTPVEQTVQRRQASLDIQHGPVFAADLFSSGVGDDIAEDQTLLLSAHHIIIDLVSWRVIWHDLAHCLQDTQRSVFSLQPSPLTFQEWCHWQREEAYTLDPKEVLPYFVPPGQWNYWGIRPGDNRFADSDLFEYILDAESTALLLGRANDTLRTETLDLLIGALVHSFRTEFSERTAPPIFLEGHGREPIAAAADLDLAETVGWFTTLHPVAVPVSETDSIIETIRYVKDTRARIPGKGRPYIASRYHSTAGSQEFSEHRDVEILLNYRGVFQQLETTGALLQRETRPDRMVAIRECGDDYQRMALVEINIVIEGGHARISTTTHKHMRHRDRLEYWVQQGFPTALKASPRELLATSHRPTLADFPLLTISYAGLDALLGEHKLASAIIRDIYPCTPVQEGIVLSESKGLASYRNSWVWTCFSSSNTAPSTAKHQMRSVSPERLAHAWKVVTRQHSVFSTVFAVHPETGRYLQVLLRETQPQCVCLTATSGLSATQYLLDMNTPTVVKDKRQAGYAFAICHSNDGEVACRLDMSHALIDASSIPVLLRHLIDAYDGDFHLERHDHINPPEYPLFSEVVRYINRETSSPDNRAYWERYLAGVQSCQLQGDLDLVQQNTPKDQYGFITLADSTTSKIASYCRHRDITRAVFFQISWALVLAQFTGLREVCFGYVCSGRDTPVEGIDEVVGPLISMLIARIDLREKHLGTILRNVGEQSIDNLSRQHASLAEIQHALGATKPLFNTAITVREEHIYGREDGLRFQEIREEDPHEVSRTNMSRCSAGSD